MRDIKFRIWNKEREVMFSEFKLVTNGFYVPNNSTTNDLDNTAYFLNYNNDRAVLMQYIGLKDKKGKGIWEGDIVIASLSGIVNEDIKSIIDFENGCFGIRAIEDGILVDSTGKFKSFDGCNTQEQIEIIGNKFENPELLKQE